MKVDIKGILERQVVGETVEGTVLIKSFNRLKNSKGGYRYEGMMSNGEEEIGFVAFEGKEPYSVIEECDSSKPIIAKIKGQTNNFSKFNIIIEGIIQIGEDDKDYDVRDWLKKVYDEEKLSETATSIIKKNVSDAGINLLKIIFKDENVVNRFKEEFAAYSHHDNCLNGLLAHTTKILQELDFQLNVVRPQLLENIPDTLTLQERKDLVFIAMTIHDMFKIEEMKFGIYQRGSVITHQVRAAMMLSSIKSTIIEYYSKEWFENIVSIMAQHHGEYEEQPRTVYAVFCHYIDNIDAQLTGFEQSFDKAYTLNGTTKTDVGDFRHLTI